MAEIKAYHRLKKMFPQAHWTRIESWTTVGIPDVNGCLKGREVWFECKEASNPRKGEPVKVKIRPAQVAWVTRRLAAGGRVYVALLIEPYLFILQGQMLEKLYRRELTYEQVANICLLPERIFQ